MTNSYHLANHYYEIDLLNGFLSFCNDTFYVQNTIELREQVSLFCQLDEDHEGLQVGQLDFDVNKKAWMMELEHSTLRGSMKIPFFIPDELWEQVLTHQMIHGLNQ